MLLTLDEDLHVLHGRERSRSIHDLLELSRVAFDPIMVVHESLVEVEEGGGAADLDREELSPLRHEGNEFLADLVLARMVVNFVGSVIWNWFFGLSLIRHMVLALGASQGFLFSSGTGVQETFQKLLSLAVVLQLIPFLYMFGALLKIAFDPNFVRGHYGKTRLILAGTSGLLTTILGIALVFFPAQQITSLLSYEIWMFGGTLGFVGLAAFFFYIYGSRKAARKLALGSPVV